MESWQPGEEVVGVKSFEMTEEVVGVKSFEMTYLSTVNRLSENTACSFS